MQNSMNKQIQTDSKIDFVQLFIEELIEIEHHIFASKGLQKSEYDSQAVLYDKLINNGLYNKIMWGNSPKDYADFCKKSLEKSEGVVADIGCGTLSFTHSVYAESNIENLFLCDLSIEMLKIGKKRLENASKDISAITFLHSDAFNMPFKDNTVQKVLSFGVFHIFENPSKFITEIVRILKPEGQLFLSSLCTDRKISEKYLNLLHQKGHVAKPLSSSEIIEIVKNNGISITEKTVKGGMLYLSGKKSQSNN